MQKGLNNPGKVFLVGAGPGDPGLITLKAVDCLKKADVVIFDYLANEEFLNFTCSEAERIYVGKKGSSHTLSQDKINQLIIDKAREGKQVVRLKGGDPFVFGRGGEEAEELAEAGISFEIVPGVTSAVSAPAYAGIPLTHRDYTSTVAFITGHEKPGKKNSQIAWEKISTGVGTLVFLMGVGNLKNIVARLRENGRDPKTPVAIICWGTTTHQRSLIGTLETIVELARQKGVKPPSIIVVGEVIALREKLDWFEKKPLFGKTVVVTRARSQASGLVLTLQKEGANVIEFPTIEIIPPESFSDLDRAIEKLADYHWLIFTSVNGVKFFFERLESVEKDVRDLKGIKLCAIGAETARRLTGRGLRLDFVPSEYRAEAILEGLAKEDLTGKHILIPRALEAREVLPDELRKRGAIVDVVCAYRTVKGQMEYDNLYDLFKRREVDAITFTSSSTVKNFVELFDSKELPQLLDGVVLASIGPITSETIRNLALAPTLQAEEYTIAGLTQALKNFFHRRGTEDTENI